MRLRLRISPFSSRGGGCLLSKLVFPEGGGLGVVIRYGLRCRFLLLLIVSFWLTCLPQDIAHAQAFGAPFGWESPWLAGVRVVPRAQVGFQQIGLNFDMPVFVPNTLALPVENLSLQLKDANVWVGGLALTGYFPSGLSLNVKGQANAKRRAKVFTPEDSQGQTLGVWWDGNRLQWWTIDANVGYPVRNDWSVVAGLRREQLSVGLVNPRFVGGVPINFYSDDIDIFGEEIQRLTYVGDVSSKLWIPYVGLRLDGPQYPGLPALEPVCRSGRANPHSGAYPFLRSDFLLSFRFRDGRSQLRHWI